LKPLIAIRLYNKPHKVSSSHLHTTTFYLLANMRDPCDCPEEFARNWSFYTYDWTPEQDALMASLMNGAASYVICSRLLGGEVVHGYVQLHKRKSERQMGKLIDDGHWQVSIENCDVSRLRCYESGNVHQAGIPRKAIGAKKKPGQLISRVPALRVEGFLISRRANIKE
jgi:hypothetical protein